MTRGRWITPDTLPAETICRVLLIPDEIEIRAAVNGAISELIYPSNWEQVGAVTVAQMAAAMDDMFFAYASSECGGFVTVDIFWDERAEDTDGGGVTANSDQFPPYGASSPFNAGNVVFGSGLFTVQPGLYEFDIWHILAGDAAFNATCRLQTSSGITFVQEGLHTRASANVFQTVRIVGIVNVTEVSTFAFSTRSSDTLATTGWGFAADITGRPEVYGGAVWRRLSNQV